LFSSCGIVAGLNTTSYPNDPVQTQVRLQEKNFKVVGVVKDLEEVKDCEVLIVINASRISRKTEEYYTKINEFKKRGIEVEIAGTEENAGRFIELITRDLHKKKK
jgi:hypothetical protein